MTRYAVLVTVCILLTALPVMAENGVSPDQILLGQSCALTGPARDLGTNMKLGMNACFARINRAGGINGRKIRLISRDDGYEPEQAIKNTRQLLEKEAVFALIGEVGTPTSQAVVPIAEKAEVPFIGPFTGAEFLRNPFKKYVINIRGSYYQEMEKLAQYLVDSRGLKKIACFYQNDGYGQAGLSGIRLALKKRGIELAATGSYERNTVAVKSGLLRIRKVKPEAVVMVGAYKPCAEFIKLAGRVGMKDALFCNISFVGTSSLIKELGAVGEGVVVSQVVNFPFDSSIPVVREYTAALQQYQADAVPGFVSLEGYLVARFFSMALEQVQGEPTRQGFIDAVDNTGTFDLGGVVLRFSASDHQGMDEVFLTVIKDGQITPLSL